MAGACSRPHTVRGPGSTHPNSRAVAEKERSHLGPRAKHGWQSEPSAELSESRRGERGRACPGRGQAAAAEQAGDGGAAAELGVDLAADQAAVHLQERCVRAALLTSLAAGASRHGKGEGGKMCRVCRWTPAARLPACQSHAFVRKRGGASHAHCWHVGLLSFLAVSGGSDHEGQGPYETPARADGGQAGRAPRRSASASSPASSASSWPSTVGRCCRTKPDTFSPAAAIPFRTCRRRAPPCHHLLRTYQRRAPQHQDAYARP